MADLPKGQGVFMPPFKSWLASNIPAVYDNTMTYYEELCALIKYLETQVVPALNHNAAAVTTISKALEQLKQYVDQYFDNLDVQEEIDNKLDEMAEDGSLASILQSLIDIDEGVNFHTYIAMPEYDNSGMQGGCVLPDGNIIQCKTSKIQKIASDGSILLQVDNNYGHCNGVTYCSKNNKIYITSTQSVIIGRYKIFELNPIDLSLTNTYDMADTFPAEPYGIVYVPESDKFVFANWWSEGYQKLIWETDINFENIVTHDYNFDVHSTSNICRFGENYIGIDVLTDNAMLLFDIKTLDFVKQIKINQLISDTWCITEPEWYDYRNGKVYLGFIAAASATPHWGAGTHIYAIYDPAINYEETTTGKSIIPPHNEIYYVDHTATPNLKRNGSSSLPFMNIYEALNSALRISDNISGYVKIVINNADTNRTYSPIFNLNKVYEVEFSPNSAINFFRMVGVNHAARVYINRGMVLQNEDELLNPYNYGDGGDLCIMGELKCVGTITKQDNSAVVICGDDNAHIKLSITNVGINVKDYWGVIDDTNNTTKNNQSLILNSHNVIGSTNSIFSSIRGVRQQITANGSGKFIVPQYSKAFIANIKWTSTNSGSSVTNEISRVYINGLWTEEVFYDDNGKYTLIYNNSTNEISVSGHTITRIIIESL